jgi:hypothetical protein
MALSAEKNLTKTIPLFAQGTVKDNFARIDFANVMYEFFDGLLK